MFEVVTVTADSFALRMLSGGELIKDGSKYDNEAINHINNIYGEGDYISIDFDNETLKIKELKYYKFTEFSRVSEKIDDYLSEFTDDIINQLPHDIDVQSVDFLLYEILINVYKHSKFNNAYLQVLCSGSVRYFLF
mgnify:CR=1 FL=1